MKVKPTIVAIPVASSANAIDVLEKMLSTPATRALLAEPGVRVLQRKNEVTGRVTYSFRSADEPMCDEDATPNG